MYTEKSITNISCLYAYINKSIKIPRGFISADCGESARGNIGHFPIYDPSIHGGGEARYLTLDDIFIYTL